MIRLHIALFILLVLMVPQVQSATSTTASEHEVRDAVSTFAHAFQEADVTVLKALLTENYIHVNGDSGNILNRDQWLTWVASRRLEIESGDYSFETYQVEDLQIQIYGDSAVVVGVTRASGLRKGVPFTIAGNFTNVWVRENGVWRRAGFHDSSLPAEGGSQFTRFGRETKE